MLEDIDKEMRKVEPIWSESYRRWYGLEQWIISNTKGFNNWERIEFLNCVTRYFISLPISDPVLVYKKFEQEVKEKKVIPRTDLRKFESIKVNVPDTFKVQNGAFVCGKFQTTITPERYKLLRKMGSDEEILDMLLKYSMLPSPALSWQIPRAVFEYMMEKHGLTLEGCASPINSQLLPLGGRYCSPFKSDAVFGSLGSLFDNNLEGEVSLINPPYVEDFMTLAANKIEFTLENTEQKTMMVFLAPKWSDAAFYTILSKSKYMKTIYQLPKNQHSYEDASIKKLAKFDSTIFVLSNYDVDLSHIMTLFK